MTITEELELVANDEIPGLDGLCYIEAELVRAAIAEIKRLQEYEWMYKDLEK